jgi:hypothetical protein
VAFERMSLDGDIVRPLIYTVLIGWIGAAAAYFWGMLFQASILSVLGGFEESAEIIPPILLSWTFGIFGLMLAPIGIVIQTFVITVLVHLSLMLAGGERNGFAATLRVVCYSGTSQLAQAIPLAGGTIATIWGLILCVVGLMPAHRTTAGRAVLAVVLPIVFCCVCIGLFFLSALVFGVGMGIHGQ